MLCDRGRVALWDSHMARLARGCRRLGLPFPGEYAIASDLHRLTGEARSGVFRVQCTAGCGGRGYGRPAEVIPTRISSVSPLPQYPNQFWRDGVRLHVCSLRLGRQPALAGIKHCSRLEYVLARSEWDDPDIPEGLLMDEQGHVTEGVVSNAFAVVEGELLTPSLDECGVAGVMRQQVLALAEALRIPARTGRFSLSTWLKADELFMTNALVGVWPVARVGDTAFSTGPVTQRLRMTLRDAGIGMEAVRERLQEDQ